MKTYILKLKGTKKNKTQDLECHVYGNNKGHAFNWAYKFFEKGEFTEPYFAEGLKRDCRGTAEFIPKYREFMELKGKYKVFHTSLTQIK
jgi:hypothetical protein